MTDKHIVIEIEDGIIQAVYCPNETYVVDILDYTDWNREAGVGHVDQSMDNYYRDVQDSTKNLKDCY